MMVGRGAGVGRLGDLVEMDGLEYSAWHRFMLEGPSEVRTQMLLAQILQAIVASTGGRPPAIESVLPYMKTLSKVDTPRVQAAQRRRVHAQRRSMVDDLIARRVDDG